MSKIFISYRRDDSAATCGRIYDRLVPHFGKAAIFKDVDSIPLGVNFAQYIGGVVQQCAVMLAVIGPQWVNIATPERGRRLDDPSDVVRLEIEAALQLGVAVIPVLVQGATMPSPNALPPSLRELTVRNGMPVRYDPDFDGDMRRLSAALERWVPRAAAASVPLPAAAPVLASVPASNTYGQHASAPGLYGQPQGTFGQPALAYAPSQQPAYPQSPFAPPLASYAAPRRGGIFAIPKYVAALLLAGALVFLILSAAYAATNGTTDAQGYSVANHNVFLEGTTAVLYFAGWLLALARAGAAKSWGWFTAMIFLPVAIFAYAFARD